MLEVHPGQLSRWLEEIWRSGPANLAVPPPPPPAPPLPAAPPFLGEPPGIGGALDAPPSTGATFLGASGINPLAPGDFNGLANVLTVSPVWHHLIYAYLLENTGVFEIFAEVVRRANAGETPRRSRDLQAIQWLRATEDLFFKDAAVVLHRQPHQPAAARNAG